MLTVYQKVRYLLTHWVYCALPETGTFTFAFSLRKVFGQQDGTTHCTMLGYISFTQEVLHSLILLFKGEHCHLSLPPVTMKTVKTTVKMCLTKSPLWTHMPNKEVVQSLVLLQMVQSLVLVLMVQSLVLVQLVQSKLVVSAKGHPLYVYKGNQGSRPSPNQNQNKSLHHPNQNQITLYLKEFTTLGVPCSLCCQQITFGTTKIGVQNLINY